MTTIVGMAILFGVLVGGVYLYNNIAQLDREITHQTKPVSKSGPK